MLRRLAATLLLFTTAITSAGQLPTKSLEARASQIVESLTRDQEHVIALFAGPDGLVGAVVENASKDRDIAWLTPHAEALLTGPLLNSRGEDQTRLAKIQKGLLLSPSNALKQAADPVRHSVVEGTNGPRITVFFDPNCVYCHQLYGALAPEIASGHVRVRFVIVGTLKASSAPRAASLLAATDLAHALALNEKGYDTANEEGGFPIAMSPDPALIAAVSSNSALFVKAGMSGTPTILYCDRATGQVRLLPGVPSDIHAFITDAGNCPP